jgi:hypothetical protein
LASLSNLSLSNSSPSNSSLQAYVQRSGGDSYQAGDSYKAIVRKAIVRSHFALAKSFAPPFDPPPGYACVRRLAASAKMTSAKIT